MAVEKHPDDSGYERSDLNPRAIGISLAILAVLILGSILVSRWFQEYAASRQGNAGAPVAAAKLPPGPRLQVEAVKDMREFRAAEDAILATYGWVNREAGLVRIPIDRAMELLVDRGLPSPAPKTKSATAK